jgi:hypothetical protein
MPSLREVLNQIINEARGNQAELRKLEMEFREAVAKTANMTYQAKQQEWREKNLTKGGN